VIYVASRCKTLLIPSGTAQAPDKKHLFFVVTDKCGQGQHLAVPMATCRPNAFYDPACEIAAGEHEFAKVKSHIMYSRAQRLKHDEIAKLVAGSVYFERPDCTAELMIRIEAGLLASDFTPKWALNYFDANRLR
jgi:hypothetical protein